MLTIAGCGAAGYAASAGVARLLAEVCGVVSCRCCCPLEAGERPVPGQAGNGCAEFGPGVSEVGAGVVKGAVDGAVDRAVCRCVSTMTGCAFLLAVVPSSAVVLC